MAIIGPVIGTLFRMTAHKQFAKGGRRQPYLRIMRLSCPMCANQFRTTLGWVPHGSGLNDCLPLLYLAAGEGIRGHFRASEDGERPIQFDPGISPFLVGEMHFSLSY